LLVAVFLQLRQVSFFFVCFAFLFASVGCVSLPWGYRFFFVSPPPVGSVLFFFATTEEEKLPKEEGRRLTFRRLKSKIMY
jgi:hypothetical protein